MPAIGPNYRFTRRQDGNRSPETLRADRDPTKT
jgi:hypothetical protein